MGLCIAHIPFIGTVRPLTTKRKPIHFVYRHTVSTLSNRIFWLLFINESSHPCKLTHFSSVSVALILIRIKKNNNVVATWRFDKNFNVVVYSWKKAIKINDYVVKITILVRYRIEFYLLFYQFLLTWFVYFYRILKFVYNINSVIIYAVKYEHNLSVSKLRLFAKEVFQEC